MGENPPRGFMGIVFSRDQGDCAHEMMANVKSHEPSPSAAPCGRGQAAPCDCGRVAVGAIADKKGSTYFPPSGSGRGSGGRGGGLVGWTMCVRARGVWCGSRQTMWESVSETLSDTYVPKSGGTLPESSRVPFPLLGVGGGQGVGVGVWWEGIHHY